MNSNAWANDAIWWHVYPLGFVGAPIREGWPGWYDLANQDYAATNRFAHLERWLDHVVRLGASGILLGPIFASRTHGYDTLDYFRIDPRLGTEADFVRFVEACHARGIRVMLDGVFNHVSREHEFVRTALREGRDSAAAGMLKIDFDNPSGPAPYLFEGHQALPELNHKSQAVADYVFDVMDYWCSRGVDAWRLDAAYTTGPEFWTRVIPRLRAKHPGVWIHGELIHGDGAQFVKDSTLDSVTQYWLWKAIWSSLSDANFWELDDALNSHNRFLESYRPLTFVGNHDVTRIGSKVGADKAVLALAILMLVGGIPAIYYGDELGYRADKVQGGPPDDQLRTSFPDRPEDIWPGSWDTFHLYQGLISLRRRNPWLGDARTEKVELTNEHYALDVVGKGGERIRLDLDLRTKPHVTISGNGENWEWAAEGAPAKDVAKS